MHEWKKRFRVVLARFFWKDAFIMLYVCESVAYFPSMQLTVVFCPFTRCLSFSLSLYLEVFIMQRWSIFRSKVAYNF